VFEVVFHFGIILTQSTPDFKNSVKIDPIFPLIDNPLLTNGLTLEKKLERQALLQTALDAWFNCEALWLKI
jgi:hypothetical protein